MKRRKIVLISLIVVLILLGIYLTYNIDKANRENKYQTITIQNSFSVTLPKNFIPMQEEQIKEKYQGAYNIEAIYKDKSDSFFFLVNKSDVTIHNEQIPEYVEAYQQTYQKANPEVVWEETKIQQKEGKTIAILTTQITEESQKKDCYIFLFEAQNQLVLCNFYCPVEQKQEGKKIAQAMLESITINK